MIRPISRSRSSTTRRPLRRALGGRRVRDVMASEVRTVPADTTLRDPVDDYFMHLTRIRSSPGG